MPFEKVPVSVQKKISKSWLIEVAWETCNQVGGIYTVVRSKASSVESRWGDSYCMVGPWVEEDLPAEFELADDENNVFHKVTLALKNKGFDLVYGRWLILGRPQVVLIRPRKTKKLREEYLSGFKSEVTIDPSNRLVMDVFAFSLGVEEFLTTFYDQTEEAGRPLVCHFHEWMAAPPILGLKKRRPGIKTIFTTHATQVGRHLAINSPMFYEHLPFFKWKEESAKFGVSSEASIERMAAQRSDVLTTVSDITGRECTHLLGRDPDFILPNGINVDRFDSLHEFQNLHSEYKEEIHQFTISHFFPSYSFDLDKTLYFFSSGRFEFKNKGFDLTLRALEVLDQMLADSGSKTTVVFFLVTRKPAVSIHPDVLESRGVMEEIRENCDTILRKIGKRLFYTSTSSHDSHLPKLNEFVDEYWKLRYRRTIQHWRTKRNPYMVTHILRDYQGDEILQRLAGSNLKNKPENRVKMVYHPDFITSSNPLFGIDYSDFVRGCNLGVFPSFYEPWGYTPMECLAFGIPAITSDLAGFGDFTRSQKKGSAKKGVYVVNRTGQSEPEQATDLAKTLLAFTNQSKIDRASQRYNARKTSHFYDWENLVHYYLKTYQHVLG